MKKIAKLLIVISALLILVMIVKGGSVIKLIISNDEDDVVGKYETIRTEQSIDSSRGEINSISKSWESININEDGTFEIEPNEIKGVYEVEEPGVIDLDGVIYKFAKDRYLYDPDISVLTEDSEYGKTPEFDDEGRTNQTFYWQKTTGRAITFDFNTDGTYKIEEILSEGIHAGEPIIVSEGKYQLEDTVLMLSYEGGSMPLIYDDDKICFDVYEKQE